MDNGKSIQQGFKEESDKIIADLQTLRDEIRLKLHLAGAEGRTAWDKLQPQLEQFEQRIGTATDAAVGELRSTGSELRGSLERLYKTFRKP
jgi:hypothetical protein